MRLVYIESKQDDCFFNKSCILSAWQVPAASQLPTSPFLTVWAQGFPEGVAKARSTRDVPAPWQLPERPLFYRFVVISSFQPDWGLSAEPPCGSTLKAVENNPAKVVLGDTL